MVNRNFRAALFAGGTLLSAAWAGPAFAQEAGASGDDGAIVVTARRMEENIQDVPISITVFNQQQLNNANVTQAADLGKIAPGLLINQKYGPENATFSMRGFFQELRTSASVGVYFADVISPRAPGSTSAGDGAGPGMFFDLQNVQVLKGPQGTLFGRNTTGGAVLLVPNKPKDRFEGYIEGSYGSYDMKRIEAVVNAPLSDTLKLRVGFDWQERDGYLHNRSPVGPRDFGNINYYAVRASLLADLTPDLENYLIATYSNSKTNGLVAHMEEAIAGRTFSTVTATQLAAEAAAGYGVYDVSNSQVDPLRFQETWRIINTTTLRASDTIVVKNIFSYSQVKVRERGDAYGTYYTVGNLLPPFAVIRSVPGGYSNHQSTLTEELQVQGRTGGDRFVWQAGAYLEISDPLSPVGTAGPSGGLACVGEPTLFQCQNAIGTSGLMTWQQMESHFRNVGIYAQGTYKFSHVFALTGGIRYTWDKVDSRFWQYKFTFPVPNVPTVTCLNSADATTVAAVYALSSCAAAESVSTSAPTWNVSLEVRPSEDSMIFLKYSRGYRQGSTNPFSLPNFKSFKDEKVDVYEAGAKLSWHGSSPGFLNVTGYYNDFTNQQIQAGALVPGLSPNAVVLNAGKSRMWGIEAEASIRLFNVFQLGANYNYLNTKLVSANYPTPGGGIVIFPTSLTGTPLPLSPNHQLVLSATLDLPVPETVGKVSLGATYSYTSEQWFTFSNQPRGRFPAHSLVNMNLNWRGIGGSPVDASVFVTNLFNEKHIILVNEQTSSGFVSRNYGEPRMFGFRLRYNFGGN